MLKKLPSDKVNDAKNCPIFSFASSKSSQFYTAHKMKLSIKDFFSKCFLRIWTHLLKKSLTENFILCAVLLLICDSCMS